MSDLLPVLILDDEKFCRLDLRNLVSRLPGVGVMHEAGTLEAARAKLADVRLAFLDVQLTRGTGFDLIADLPRQRRPEVIFTTAHREYATEAFAVNAVDYLLKPVEESRLREAWHRAIDRINTRRMTGVRRFTLRTASGMELLPVTTLIAVTSEGNYVKLHLAGRLPVLVRDTFEHWLSEFPPQILIEIGRGRAINREHCVVMEGTKESRVVAMSDGSRHPVSRRSVGEVESTLFLG